MPASYSLINEGYGTTIKNQGADGDCWAFAITTAMESNLKKTEGVDIEFSPKQLDYLISEGSPYYTYLNTKLEFTRGVGDGGNFLASAFVLGGQYAPVREDVFFQKMKNNDTGLASFSTWRDFNDAQMVNSLLSVEETPAYTKPISMDLVMSDGEYLVTEYESLGSSTNAIKKVKEAVYKTGAAYVGTYGPGTENCWDADTKTIIDRGKIVCGPENGHAMAIVGWDDNHTYTDPATGTTKTGAFRLQNSWGTSDLLSRYDVTYDRIVEEWGIDESEYTAEELQSLRDLVDNYDAKEYVWLAYDFNSSSYAGATIDFGVIKEMRKNDYKKVYDLSDMLVGLGSDTANSFEFAYNTGENEEYIEAIAVAHHALSFRYSGSYLVYVDKENNGEYEKVGELPLTTENIGAQYVLDLDEQVEVSGPFKVKIEMVKDNGEELSLPVDYADLLTTAVYMAEEMEIPNTGSEEPRDEKVEDEKNKDGVKAPNAGFFGGEHVGAKIAGATIVVLAGAYLSVAIFKNRKHLFHKIDFTKK